MEFSEEQLEKLGHKPKKVSKEKSNDRGIILKLKDYNQKNVSKKLNSEELKSVLDLIEETKSKGGDKVLVVSLDYVGDHRDNCISVEGELFYYYQYLFYDSYQMRPIFNGEGLMVILKNKRPYLNKKKNGETK